MLEHIIIVVFFLLSLLSLQIATAQSVVWDEATKSWISAPAPAPTPAPPPPTPPTQIPQTPQQQFQQQYNPPVFQQPTTVTSSNATLDIGTLAGILTPILAGIAGVFIKNRRDMEKKSKEVNQTTLDMIEQSIIPKIQQIIPVAEQTAQQDVKINDIANLIYKLMGEKANEIVDMPGIKQQQLLEDAIRSKITAEQIAKENKKPPPAVTVVPAKQAKSSLVWDDATKEWVSK